MKKIILLAFLGIIFTQNSYSQKSYELDYVKMYGTYIIKPRLYNLIILKSVDTAEFDDIMKQYNYSLDRIKGFYFAKTEGNILFGIRKENHRIFMGFQEKKYMLDELVKELQETEGIEYTTKNGIDIYTYATETSFFQWVVSKDKNGMGVVLFTTKNEIDMSNIRYK